MWKMGTNQEISACFTASHGDFWWFRWPEDVFWTVPLEIWKLVIFMVICYSAKALNELEGLVEKALLQPGETHLKGFAEKHWISKISRSIIYMILMSENHGKGFKLHIFRHLNRFWSNRHTAFSAETSMSFQSHTHIFHQWNQPS